MRLLPALLFIVALLLRVGLLIGSGFDGLYGQDAYAYHQFAALILKMLGGQAPLTGFYWPLGYPALLASAYHLFGAAPAVGQATNVLLGALLAPLIYGLGREIGLRRSGAAVAGLLLALGGQAAQSSLVLMSDIPALVWVTGSAFLLACWKKRGGDGRLLTAAALLALAIITRWTSILLIPLWTLAAWRSWKPLLAAALLMVCVFLPQHLFDEATRSPGPQHDYLNGWSLMHAFESAFTDIDGHFEYAQTNISFYSRFVTDPYFNAPLFAPLLLIGLYSAFRRGGWGWIIGWALLNLLFLLGITHQNDRFLLTMSVPAALLVGAGLDNAKAWAQGRRGVPPALALLLAAGSLHMIGAAAQTVPAWVALQQHNKDAALRTVQRLPVGVRVYTFSQTLALREYGDFEVIELYELAPETLQAQWQAGQDDYLLVNGWELENQWAGRSPQIAYHWLRDQRGLEQIARYGNFTLYRVKG